VEEKNSFAECGFFFAEFFAFFFARKFFGLKNRIRFPRKKKNSFTESGFFLPNFLRSFLRGNLFR
jgi:hypothetical protein